MRPKRMLFSSRTLDIFHLTSNMPFWGLMQTSLTQLTPVAKWFTDIVLVFLFSWRLNHLTSYFAIEAPSKGLFSAAIIYFSATKKLRFTRTHHLLTFIYSPSPRVLHFSQCSDRNIFFSVFFLNQNSQLCYSSTVLIASKINLTLMVITK